MFIFRDEYKFLMHTKVEPPCIVDFKYCNMSIEQLFSKRKLSTSSDSVGRKLINRMCKRLNISNERKKNCLKPAPASFSARCLLCEGVIREDNSDKPCGAACKISNTSANSWQETHHKRSKRCAETQERRAARKTVPASQWSQS